MSLGIPSDGRQLASVYESWARINLWHGSVRSGKTIGSLWRWIRYVLEGPEGKLAMVGKTERTLLANVLQPLQELVGGGACAINRGEGRARVYDREIGLYGANDIRSEEKIRGVTLAGAYCDEITVWPESMFQQVLARCSVPGSKIFGTTNPDSPAHWLKKNYLDREAGTGHEDELLPEQFRSFHFGLDDNPFLDPQYKADLIATAPPLWRARMIEGLWAVAEGAVFPHWDPEEHILQGAIPEDMAFWWLGLDYGHTHPTAGILLGSTGSKIIACGEYRAAEKTNTEHSIAMERWLESMGLSSGRLRSVAADPGGGGKALAQQLRLDGWGGVRNAKKEVEQGLTAVGSLLQTNRLLIHESCTGLLEEIPSYRWDPNAQAQGKDIPLKENDDSMDALRYGVMAARPEWKFWISNLT